MTSLSIEHRTSPVVLSNEDLLASQRALLDVSLNDQEGVYASPYLSQQAINRLGEALAYDVSLMVDETQLESGRPLAEVNSTQNHLALMARTLLEYDPKKDPYEGFDRTQVKIHEATSVRIEIKDGYNLYGADGTIGWNDRIRFFTPEGFVDDPVGDFKQKLVTFDMSHESTFAEDAYFDFSSRGRLSIYTNNLIAQTPRWEYMSGDGRGSDMKPGRNPNPYFFHLAPNLIVGEELAQAVVGSLARVINES